MLTCYWCEKKFDSSRPFLVNADLPEDAKAAAESVLNGVQPDALIVCCRCWIDDFVGGVAFDGTPLERKLAAINQHLEMTLSGLSNEGILEMLGNPLLN